MLMTCVFMTEETEESTDQTKGSVSPETWTTFELFRYLQRADIIKQDALYADWINHRADMLKAVIKHLWE